LKIINGYHHLDVISFIELIDDFLSGIFLELFIFKFFWLIQRGTIMENGIMIFWH